MNQRRITKIVLTCVCLLGAALPVLGQQKEAGSPGILGRLDPRTGAFKPVASPAISDAVAAATPNATGKLVFNFTITIVSALPATSNLTCNASASVSDINIATAA